MIDKRLVCSPLKLCSSWRAFPPLPPLEICAHHSFPLSSKVFKFFIRQLCSRIGAKCVCTGCHRYHHCNQHCHRHKNRTSYLLREYLVVLQELCQFKSKFNSHKFFVFWTPPQNVLEFQWNECFAFLGNLLQKICPASFMERNMMNGKMHECKLLEQL